MFVPRPEKALPFYHRAIAVWERESDPINRASTLHHIGNCEAYGGRWRVAMDAYIRAGSEFVELEAVEYVSNSLGEAGLIISELEPLTDLPERHLVQAGLQDVVERLVGLFREPDDIRDQLRVILKKVGGIISLAAHTGNSDLLEQMADAIADEILLPMVEVEASQIPELVKMLVWHVQWLTRLCAFLSIEIDRVPPEEQFKIIITLAARGFPPPEHEVMAAWIASFFRRVRGMEGMTKDRVRAALDEAEW